MTDQLAIDELDDGDADEPDTTVADPGAESDVEPDTEPESDVEPESAPPVAAGRFARRRQRVSKWDRPPDPKDWRYFVGTLGKVLIATGILMFGFVAYQLWGTGIETARAQNRLENEFELLLEEFAQDNGTDDASEAASGSGDADDEASSDADDVGEPSGADPSGEGNLDVGTAVVTDGDAVDLDAEADDQVVVPDAEITTAVPVALDLSDQAIVQDPIPAPDRGDALFRLEVPAIGRDDIVVAGVSLNDLKNGPGHYPDTPLPGQLGNASVAGHRTTYGAPFFNVDQLRAGDEIITTLVNGDRFVYEVTSIEVVSASDYWVVTTRDPNIAELTLTSCHPKYTARDRIVVHSVLNPEKSSNVGFPTFYELEPDDSEIPGDDPVLQADPNDITVTDGGSVGAAPSEPADTEAAPGIEITSGDIEARPSEGVSDVDDPDDDLATAADDAAADADDQSAATSEAGDGPTPQDAFSQGWFDDSEAFPQIALWGMVLTIISLLAYQVSKKTRHDSIGFMVGIAPFLIALYFFFQNVNRLLPPGI